MFDSESDRCARARHGRHVFVSEVGPQLALDTPTGSQGGTTGLVCLGGESQALGTTVGGVGKPLDVPERFHLVDDLDSGRLVTSSSSASSVTREETFIVLSGAITARYAEHEETVEAGRALILPADTTFSLVSFDRRPSRSAFSPSADRR